LWEDKNAALLSQKETIRSGNGGQRRYDSILTVIRNIDLDYVRQHPHSYVSGLLLSKHKRRMPVDSVEIYFDLLQGNVQNSSIGYEVLSHIYPLSNNAAFKNKYPVFGNDFNAALSAVKSIHDIRLSDPSGKMISFGKFKGNYILLDFWASWCGPCISDMPYFEKIIKAYKKYPIKFVSVSLDKDAAEWKKAIKKYKPSSLQLGDMKAFSGLLPVYCKLPVGVPTYMLVDKNGTIINYQLPRPQEIELRQLLDKLLLEK
jgi:thiol-disulfide isomerase/thioredoxin